MNPSNARSLAQAWQDLQTQTPHVRIRQAAQQLGVSEAELLATTVGQGTTRLRPDWKTLLKRLPQLGYVMSLTRNEACVLEHKGHFEKVQVFGKGDHQMGLAIGPIETRIFLNAWHVAFAVEQETADRRLVSLQVFDRAGEAITKIYMQPQSDEAAYEQLVADLRSDDQSTTQHVQPYPHPSLDAPQDAEAFLQDWADLKDTHDFFPLLKKHSTHRYQAVRVAEGRFTRSFPISALEPLLAQAAQDKLPIMIFAGNRGNLQIHQDRVRTIRMMQRGDALWLNVLDPEFNMHLRQDLIQDAWVVVKPTEDGHVTAIECYDKDHELIAQFFGLRKPGIPELEAWRDLVASHEQTTA
ncbi:MAG: hemin-degrading factor [Bernardetiaceae bacterium]